MNEPSEIEQFNQLFAKYQSRFIHFAYSYVRDRTIAEDFVMEAFMYYWEHRDTLAKDSNIPAYILVTIKNKALNYLHHIEIVDTACVRIKTHSQWELDTRISRLEACNPEELFSKEIKELVEKTLDRLPLQTRKVFIESRINNKSHKEIAQMYAISTKTVEFHISKALKILRVSLKDYLSVFLLFL